MYEPGIVATQAIQMLKDAFEKRQQPTVEQMKVAIQSQWLRWLIMKAEIEKWKDLMTP